jgi:hypothetical protein
VRIRSTKPEFWRSERVASVDWHARLVLKGLESYVDDNGVGKDDLALICGDLFMRDLAREPSRTLARVSEGITELHAAGLLHRYEGGGTSLLFLSFWESFQRVDKPQPGRMPRPDGTFNYKDSLIGESLANVREASRKVAPGTGEQGNRGTEEQGNSGAEGAAAPLSPFCSKHPNGTEDPCRACGTARTAYELAAKTDRSKPTPVPFTVLPGTICLEGMHKLLADGTCTMCTYRAEVA